MNKNNCSHIQGKNGQAFTDLVRGIAQEQILCVSLDISKYFHVVMIHNSSMGILFASVPWSRIPRFPALSMKSPTTFGCTLFLPALVRSSGSAAT